MDAKTTAGNVLEVEHNALNIHVKRDGSSLYSTGLQPGGLFPVRYRRDQKILYLSSGFRPGK